MNLGKETETLEHKKSTSEIREGIASIASILNKHGHGTLFFGVKDDGEVIGQQVGKDTERKVSQAIGNMIEPRVSATISSHVLHGDVGYIEVSFAGDEAPYSCDGRFRIRRADEDVLMSSAQIEEAFRARANRRDPWDARPSGRPVSDVAPGIVERYVAKGNECGRIREAYTSNGDVLVRLGLVAPDGSLTNAAAMLFCPSTLDPRLTMGVLGGNDKVNILDLRHESGPVFELIDAAELYVFSNVRRRLVISGAASREEVPEVPREAVREAVTNAFCHRDYESGQAVEVNIYLDSVEVSNPGLFPPGDTPERHLSGESVSSECRNLLMAQTLFRAGMIERYGSGIMRIKDSCDQEGVPFSYAQRAGRTSVSFERVGAQNAAAPMPPVSSAHLSPAAEQVLLEMRGQGPVTSDAAAQVLGVSRRQAQRILRELRDAGLAKSSRSGNKTVWKIVG